MRINRSIRKFFLANTYRQEIGLVIILKLVAIFLLWYFLFSHSASHELKPTNLVNHYVSENLK